MAAIIRNISASKLSSTLRRFMSSVPTNHKYNLIEQRILRPRDYDEDSDVQLTTLVDRFRNKIIPVVYHYGFNQVLYVDRTKCKHEPHMGFIILAKTPGLDYVMTQKEMDKKLKEIEEKQSAADPYKNINWSNVDPSTFDYKAYAQTQIPINKRRGETTIKLKLLPKFVCPNLLPFGDQQLPSGDHIFKIYADWVILKGPATLPYNPDAAPDSDSDAAPDSDSDS